MSDTAERSGRGVRIALAVISGYRKVLSPFLGRNCRYLPTCSRYTADAIAVHGVARGSWLGIRRIGRCHPFRAGGYDPVPPARHRSTSHRPGMSS